MARSTNQNAYGAGHYPLAMKFYIAVTDREWFEYLGRASPLEEVNFWQPTAGRAFQALPPGGLFLFKLHGPGHRVAGGGIFSHWTRLRVSLAWDAFGIKNGAASLPEMRSRIERYRRGRSALHEDYEVGCILLQQPFFLDPSDRVEIPDWQPNIVRGRTYDTDQESGRTLWQELYASLQARREPVVREVSPGRYGQPTLIAPRLGQGSFKVMVLDAYRRQCAVTGEKALPVLQAAHIIPFVEGGEHRLDNGLLLRTDVHILFDRGYVTVTPDYRFQVSPRLKRDFDNGELYYQFDAKEVWLPPEPKYRPKKEFLAWHADTVFMG